MCVTQGCHSELCSQGPEVDACTYRAVHGGEGWEGGGGRQRRPAQLALGSTTQDTSVENGWWQFPKRIALI